MESAAPVEDTAVLRPTTALLDARVVSVIVPSSPNFTDDLVPQRLEAALGRPSPALEPLRHLRLRPPPPLLLLPLRRLPRTAACPRTPSPVHAVDHLATGAPMDRVAPLEDTAVLLPTTAPPAASLVSRIVLFCSNLTDDFSLSGFGSCTGAPQTCSGSAAAASSPPPATSTPSASSTYCSKPTDPTGGTCGGSTGNQCGAGYCCSSGGYCGTAPNYCSAGCQSGFGTCTNQPAPTCGSSTPARSAIVTRSGSQPPHFLVYSTQTLDGGFPPNAYSMAPGYTVVALGL
jgi:hypothetical protein